jgi:transposase
MNLETGKRLFLVRYHQKQEDFQAFLRLIHNHYRGWHVSLVLDENPSHTANRSEQLANDLNIKLLWLPKRSPELNPMDELWGQAKDVVSANRQYASVDEHVTHFIEYLHVKQRCPANSGRSLKDVLVEVGFVTELLSTCLDGV